MTIMYGVKYRRKFWCRRFTDPPLADQGALAGNVLPARHAQK